VLKRLYNRSLFDIHLVASQEVPSQTYRISHVGSVLGFGRRGVPPISEFHLEINYGARLSPIPRSGVNASRVDERIRPRGLAHIWKLCSISR